MDDLGGMTVSRHAARRCAQRGVSPKCLAALIEHADIEIPVGSGAFAWSISREQVNSLNLPRKLGRFAAVLSEDAVLITVAPIHNGQRGRRWRRGIGKG